VLSSLLQLLSERSQTTVLPEHFLVREKGKCQAVTSLGNMADASSKTFNITLPLFLTTRDFCFQEDDWDFHSHN
jgi:hypothetical protein